MYLLDVMILEGLAGNFREYVLQDKKSSSWTMALANKNVALIFRYDTIKPKKY